MTRRPIMILWGISTLMSFVKKCGRIADMDLDLPDVQQEAAEQTGYQITKSQMVVYGICPECAQQEQVAS